jgi:hypothetical protein
MQASEMEIFNSTFHWLLIEKPQNNAKSTIVYVLFGKNINVNSEITLASVKSGNALELLLYDIW